jgi:pyridoxal phosphate enzyme, YggS family
VNRAAAMSEPAAGAPVDAALVDRLAAVRSGIQDAARAAGRDAAELTTIVVTKFHPAGLVRGLAALGVRDIGENRHQEAAAKAAELSDLHLTWHFIGQLQTNKARQVRRYARVVHSVDRAALADALASAEGLPIECFVQVNLTDDPARGGVSEAELEPLAEHVLANPGLRLLGVMGVAPLHEEPRRAFSRLYEDSLRMRAIAPHADRISAGMSADYAAAIAEGATHLRIGSAITGNRPARG